jgi:hypothetical protein
MTLIVYSENTLYADDCIVISEGHYNARLSTAQKLILSACKRVAIAFLGGLPTGVELELIRNIVCTRIIAKETGQDADFKLDPELVKAITDNGSTSFFALTRKNCYELREDFNPVILNPQMDAAWGTGSSSYFLCRNAGLTNLQAYKQVSCVTRTVSNKITSFKAANLKPIAVTKT